MDLCSKEAGRVKRSKRAKDPSMYCSRDASPHDSSNILMSIV
jgi:hypothetical protein